jgi:hypothetical protein
VLDGDIYNYIVFSPTHNGMDLYDSNLKFTPGDDQRNSGWETGIRLFLIYGNIASAFLNEESK